MTIEQLKPAVASLHGVGETPARRGGFVKEQVMSEISCENCGAYDKTADNFFRCAITGATYCLSLRWPLARICLHYPVLKPPERGMFEKAWEKQLTDEILDGENAVRGTRCKECFQAGYLAAVGQVREWIQRPETPLDSTNICEILDQMTASAKEQK